MTVAIVIIASVTMRSLEEAHVLARVRTEQRL